MMMPYVKAEVTEEVQKALNMAAVEEETTVANYAGDVLEQWYETSAYEGEKQ